MDNTQPRPLAGRVALVTGAGRGIGRAIATGYAQAGANVCCVARTQSDIEAVVAAITAAGGSAIAITGDVTRADEVEHMVRAAVAAFGGLDVLVANAGIGGDRRPVADSDPDQWRDTIAVNLIGPYLCARAAIPAMRARGGGRMLFLGSGARQRGIAGRSDYACSKAGLWALVQSLAAELRTDDISVNELVPGPVRTAMTAPAQARLQSQPGDDGAWLREPEVVVPQALALAAQRELEPTGQSFSLRRADP